MPGSKNAPEGWFSRRHQTREAHDAAVEQYAQRASSRPKQVFVGGDAWDHGCWSKEAA